MSFPIDLAAFRPLSLDPSRPELTAEDEQQLAANIQLCRDVIVFFTACAAGKGLGGHTGGAYDIVPEVLIWTASCAAAARWFRSISMRLATGWPSSTSWPF